MGKTGKWIRNFLTGKKDKDKDKNLSSNHHSVSSTHDQNPTTPIAILPTTSSKEKRRWSFRRSSAAGTGQREDILSTTTPAALTLFESENEQKKHAVAVAVATAAAADAAVAAAHAAAAMMRLTAASAGRASPAEEAAATKIQSVFRSYLARKALSALRGLVKLQALVRGHLVRKQATATLRCMQALVTVQARARAQRIGITEEMNLYNHRQMIMRNSTPDNRYRNIHQDQMEENIKIVEMDLGQSKGSTKSRNSYSSNTPTEKTEHHRYSTYKKTPSDQPQISPSPSAITELSPRSTSNHFEDFSFGTTQSSPQYYSAISNPDPSKTPFTNYPRAEYAESLSSYEYTLFPNYMANTKSSQAKVRSHSAPKQRPADPFERQLSVNKRRPSIEGRNVPRAVRYQRSSSQVGSAAQNYQYPWSVVKLDKSTVSLVDSECGSTSTVMTNPHYCRSLVGFDIQGHRY